MPVRSSRSTSRRTRRTALVAAAILPSLGVVALSGSGAAVLPMANASSSGATEMAYDRDLVAELRRRDSDARRQKVLDWFRLAAALDDSRRDADLRRASRGEPRQALGDPSAPGASAQHWRPTTGRLTQPYHPGHGGIDVAVPVGTPVVAAAAGVVSFAGTQSGYGTHLEVRHPDGAVTTYSHLSAIEVAVGEPVEAGQQIADSGNTGRSTGPHLHFELRPGEGRTSDPIAWLRSYGAW